ncbi:MAG: hypothetical protein MUF81_20800 [Verrucomicrobia bacterium]|nr:hypothetical protein [Verrucomicrobiota bacterium]
MWPPCRPTSPPSTPPPPAKFPSKRWRDLILQVWHTDPLICPQCQHPLRVMAVIDPRAVVEKILRHLHLWSGSPPLAPGRRRWAMDPRGMRRHGSDETPPAPAGGVRPATALNGLFRAGKPVLAGLPAGENRVADSAWLKP